MRVGSDGGDKGGSGDGEGLLVVGHMGGSDGDRQW